MKTSRSMVLISHDPVSIQQGADAVLEAFQQELNRLQLQDEVSLSLVEDIGRNYASPLVIVYPEAVIYGRVSVEDVPHLVEEHLFKGRIVEEKIAPAHEL
ncbi:MAG TPA: (2Fe-2S) ferredoxin domain-containing protein, partial [Anaerolineaceae bacterium]|nr:(2Fe-2S) ferredoxin domain-containing protein [Anaerolineaceae bacterium]